MPILYLLIVGIVPISSCRSDSDHTHTQSDHAEQIHAEGGPAKAIVILETVVHVVWSFAWHYGSFLSYIKVYELLFVAGFCFCGCGDDTFL